jgi:hypothetical protein
MSPAGVKGRVYVDTEERVGLCSREVGIELPGPIENAPWCFGGCSDESTERLVGLVDVPDDPGRESSTCVVDGEGPGGDSCGVIIDESSSASTFWRGAPFTVVSTWSRDLVAAGVIGGECIEEGRGLWWGDGLPDEVYVFCRLAS